MPTPWTGCIRGAWEPDRRQMSGVKLRRPSPVLLHHLLSCQYELLVMYMSDQLCDSTQGASSLLLPACTYIFATSACNAHTFDLLRAVAWGGSWKAMLCMCMIGARSCTPSSQSLHVPAFMLPPHECATADQAELPAPTISVRPHYPHVSPRQVLNFTSQMI